MKNNKKITVNFSSESFLNHLADLVYNELNGGNAIKCDGRDLQFLCKYLPEDKLQDIRAYTVGWERYKLFSVKADCYRNEGEIEFKNTFIL